MPDPALLMKSDKGDFIFVEGQWKQTQLILDFMYGKNDFVETITQDAAKAQFPEAFSQ